MIEQKKRLYTLYSLTALSVLAALVFSWVQFRNTLEPQYWVSANQHLSTLATENSTVLSFWDNGWWIRDQVHCKAFVNNGSHSKTRDEATASVYCATCDPCAYHIAIANGIDYVIFSAREDHVYKQIVHDCGYQGLKERTLWYRALQDDFSSDYFIVLYRAKEIVILGVSNNAI